AGDVLNFTITGGGLLFQVGPEVITAQQIRIGIQSVSTVNLGGVSGRLYQLRSGNNADLITDNKLADKIIEDAILYVSMLRGRLGAIQRSTLEPTIASLQDNLTQITTAESQISNTDFAEESSRLTRAQILVQAGARTLSIANQLPQYAASLLGG
ncbi:MAG: flagellin, partial [Planctomycetaceae bacterium]|nr:flagellin [Planctomycetaceae bacterium]